MNFQIKVSDVQTLYDKTVAAFGDVFLPLEDKWYRAGDKDLGNRQFIVQDPDGYLLRSSKTSEQRKGKHVPEPTYTRHYRRFEMENNMAFIFAVCRNIRPYGAITPQKTRVINTYLEGKDHISEKLTQFLIIGAYMALFLAIGCSLDKDNTSLDNLSSAVNAVWGISMIVWGFMVRTRMNYLLSADKGEAKYFSKLWTFLFTPFYLNYKVNQLQELDEQGILGCIL